jgi:hypothetical protein
MGREVRRVPKDWRHPKDAAGRFVPLFGSSVSKEQAEWDEGAEQWARGFARGYGKDDPEWVPKDDADKACSWEEWSGKRPVAEDYMPDWPEAERTHWQLYEHVSEGTPMSPPMDSPETLAAYLADFETHDKLPYETWLGMIRKGWAPSGVIDNGVMRSGVEFVGTGAKWSGE